MEDLSIGDQQKDIEPGKIALSVKEAFGSTVDFGLSVNFELAKPENKAKLDTPDDNNVSYGLKMLSEVLRVVSDNSAVQNLKLNDTATIETDVVAYTVLRTGEKLRVSRKTIRDDQPAAAGLYRGGVIEITGDKIVAKELLEGVYHSKSQSSGQSIDRTDLVNLTLAGSKDRWFMEAESVAVSREMKPLDDSSWKIWTTTRGIKASLDEGIIQFETRAPKKVESSDHL